MQIHFVGGLFGLDIEDALSFAAGLPEEPQQGETYLAFPRVASVAKKHFPGIEDTEKQRFAVLNMFFKFFEKHIGLNNKNNMFLWELNQENEHGRTDWKRHNTTESAVKSIEEKQRGDILIISAQFGCLRVGQSTVEARGTLELNEFGLDSMMLGLALFMHPYYIREGYPGLVAAGEDIGCSYVPCFSYHYMESKYERLRSDHISFRTVDVGYKDGDEIIQCTGYVL